MPEITVTKSPEFPALGQKLAIAAACVEGLTNIKLTITAPSGVILGRSPVEGGRDGDVFTWNWTSDPTEERGWHEIKITADGDICRFDSVSVVAGEPRTQYERTYVLLPPDAGAEWALTVIEETWDEHRYTIGSSADDSGIGNLGIRNVIAINAGHWPSDLATFYEEFYPGVKLVCIDASTPADLRGRFQARFAAAMAVSSLMAKHQSSR